MKGLVTSMLLLTQAGLSQTDTLISVTTPFVSLGYAHESPRYVREFYDNIVEGYRYNGIPIPTQVEFGRTLTVNGGILYGRVPEIKIGLSVGYSFSPAYSNYKDYVGSLEINGFTSALDISFKGVFTVMMIGNAQMNLDIQVGAFNRSASITQSLHFQDFPQENYDGTWSASAWGPFSQLTIGFPVHMGTYTLSFEGGYRYSSGQVTNQTVKSSEGNYTTDLHWDIGSDGFVFLITCGMDL
jgi:hypothetical protein